MTALPVTSSATQSTASVRVDSPALTLRILVFGVGATLPFISFSAHSKITTSLASRVEAVDVLCLVTLAALLVGGRLKFSAAWLAYAGAIVLGLGVSLTGAPFGAVITPFAALMMAALFCLVGASVAESPALSKALLAGVVVGALGESVIVIHDYLLPQWFRAIHKDRVRGTFRSAGQLGNYGLTVAGLLFCFGWGMFDRWQSRMLAISGGLLGLFMVLAATRRSAMFAMIAWLLVYLLLGLKQVSRKSYWAIVGLTVLAVVMLIVYQAQVKETHFGERFLDAWNSVESGKSFTHIQFENAMDRLGKWFPLGVGVGQGKSVVITGEAHNGHLALAVELGVLGLVSFYWLWARPFFRKWEGSFGVYTPVVRLAVYSFLVAAAVSMIHSRLHRDRCFMLFMGLAPAVASATSLAGRQTFLVYRRVANKEPGKQPVTN